MTNAIGLIRGGLAAPGRPCLTSSFQADCMVLLHLVLQERPDIPVLFLDTLHHFDEVLAYRDRMAGEWGLNLVTLRAAQPAVGRWRQSVDDCCAVHKVGPLFEALTGYDTWFTALRREQSPSRAGLPFDQTLLHPSGTSIRKISPLADWTTADVNDYTRTHGIPELPLYAQGYTSIGCAPCTERPADPDNPRSGRWSGRKLECGIHLPPPGRARSH